MSNNHLTTKDFFLQKSQVIEKIYNPTLMKSAHKSHKYLKIVDGKYIYNYDAMTTKDHDNAIGTHLKLQEQYGLTNTEKEKHKISLEHGQEAEKHAKLKKEKAKKESDKDKDHKIKIYFDNLF